VGRSCPECGRDVEELFEGLCSDCFKRSRPLVRVKRIVSLVRCPRCGSTLYRGRWIRGSSFRKLVLEALEPLGRLTHVDVGEEPREPGLHSITIEVRGVREPLPSEYAARINATVRVTEELCPDCKDIVLGRERAVLQVRSKLPLTDEVRSIIMGILKNEVGREDGRGAVVGIEYVDDGFDIKFNDQGLARIVAQRIHRTIPSRVTESQRVITIRGGRKVTKLSISLQLLPLRRGLNIRIGGEDYVVVSFTSSKVKLKREGEVSVLSVREILRRGVELG